MTIFSGALFHTLAASQIKLFFALVDLPTSVWSPRVTLLVSTAFSCLSLTDVLQRKPLNGITLRERQTDSNIKGMN